MVRALLVLGALLCAQTAAAESKVDVRVTSRVIGDDEDLQVTFSFQGSGEGRLPDLSADWKIVGQHTQRNTQFANGRVFRENARVLVLKPKRTGRLTIGPAQIVSGGQVMAESAPIPIQVRGVAPMKPSEAMRVENLARDVVFLMPEIHRDSYYVGEPFVVTWVLYVKRGSRIHQPDLSEIELPEAIQRQDVLNGDLKEEEPPGRFWGQRYVRVPVMREVWKVLRPEHLTIPSVRVSVSIPGRGFGRSNRKRLKTPPLFLNIEAVPATGRPRTYREGTIGQFSVESTIQGDEEHGRALLEVRIAGIGSLRTLDRPAIEDVSGAVVKPLPSDDQDAVHVTKEGVVGHRVFQYLVTPERAGTVFIPAVELTWFDPAQARFLTAKSEPVTWLAKRAIASTRRSAVANAGVEGGQATLHPIESESDLSSVERTPLHSRGWFYGLLAVPLLLFLLLELRAGFAAMQARGGDRARARRALSQAKRALTDADSLAATRPGELFALVAQELRAYTSRRKGLALTGLTNDQMRRSLERAGIGTELAERLIAELENCDFARFAGGAGPGSDPQTSLNRARALLDELEAAT